MARACGDDPEELDALFNRGEAAKHFPLGSALQVAVVQMDRRHRPETPMHGPGGNLGFVEVLWPEITTSQRESHASDRP